MSKYDKISFEEIDELLTYCPDSGNLYWKVDQGWWAKKGKVAGSINNKSTGRKQIKLKQLMFYQTNVIWLLVHKRWPTKTIDHINRDAGDNRLKNLREVSNTVNSYNQKKKRHSTNKFKGVKRCSNGKWNASIVIGGTEISIGMFDSEEEAARHYDKNIIEWAGQEVYTNYAKGARN